MSAPACPACGKDGTRTWFCKRGYTHRYCQVCGHGFVNPSPDSEEIDAYYRGLSSGLCSYCSWETEPRHKLKLWRALLDRAEAASGLGPLLDLGCGAGQFLRLAREMGWEDLAGVEISEKAVALAREATGGQVYQGAWAEVPLEPDHFAAVVLLDVLEHAPDPRALLRHVHALLRPGGSLLLTVPNRKGVAIRVFGKAAYVVVPPEHVSYFTRLSLARMLEREGFDVAWQTTQDIYLKEWLRFLPGRAGDSQDSGSATPDRAKYDRWYRRLSGNAALRLIGAANRVLAATGLGDQLVCIARKPQ